MAHTACVFVVAGKIAAQDLFLIEIVGTRIGTKAFELLAIMLLFEAMFGLTGLVMAPIVYAYAKAELRAAGWL